MLVMQVVVLVSKLSSSTASCQFIITDTNVTAELSSTFSKFHSLNAIDGDYGVKTFLLAHSGVETSPWL